MMVLTWFIGVQGIFEGGMVIGYLRDGILPEMTTVAQQAKDADDPLQYIAAARLRAMAEAREVTFPLSAAKMLLAGFLLVASGLAMTGRPGARNLALKALAANAALAALDYALTRGVRGTWIDDGVRVGEYFPKIAPEQAFILKTAFWWWVGRVRFALVDVGVLTLAAVALTRPRTSTFFAAVAAERSDEP